MMVRQNRLRLLVSHDPQLCVLLWDFDCHSSLDRLLHCLVLHRSFQAKLPTRTMSIDLKGQPQNSTCSTHFYSFRRTQGFMKPINYVLEQMSADRIFLPTTELHCGSQFKLHAKARPHSSFAFSKY